MKKLLAITLVLALVLSMVACGSKKPDPKPADDPGKTTGQAIDNPNKGEDPNQGNDNPNQGEDPNGGEPEYDPAKVIPFKTQQEFRDFLCGTWVDDIENPVYYLGLCSDGTLIIFNDMDMECKAYAGSWDLQQLFAADDGIPDLLVLLLSDYSDEFIGGMTSAGDYIFSTIDNKAETPRIHMVQANNGDSLYSLYYNKFELDMYKISDMVSFENPAETRFLASEKFMDICGHWTLVSGEIEGWEWNAKDEHITCTLDLNKDYTAELKYEDDIYDNDEHYTNMYWWPTTGMVSYWYNANDDGTREIEMYKGDKMPGTYNDWCIFFQSGEDVYFVCELQGENKLYMVWYEFGGEEPAAAGMTFER